LLEGQETWDATGIRSSWEVTCVDVSLTDT
jgi:hypothetical protein